MKKIIIIVILAMAPAALAIDESESICSNDDLTQVLNFWTNNWIEETWDRMERKQPGSVDKLIDQGGDVFILALADYMESISSEGARDLENKVYNECQVRLDYTGVLAFWDRFVDNAIRYENYLME